MLNGEDKLILSGSRMSEVSANIRNTRSQLHNDLTRAYRWVIAPSQRNPQQAEYTLNPAITPATETGEIVRSADKKLVKDEKLVDEIAPSQLARYLKTYIWDNENDHITIEGSLGTLHQPRLPTPTPQQSRPTKCHPTRHLKWRIRILRPLRRGQIRKPQIQGIHRSSQTDTLYDVPGLIVEPEMAALQSRLRLRKSLKNPLTNLLTLTPTPTAPKTRHYHLHHLLQAHPKSPLPNNCKATSHSTKSLEYVKRSSVTSRTMAET